MIFYLFSVKIMLKMHQKPFGGWAPVGLAGELKVKVKVKGKHRFV